MSLQIERLQKNVLNSYENTRSFLEGRSTLVAIATQRDLFLDQPLYFATQYLKLNRRWRIIQVLSYPIRMILRFFLMALRRYVLIGRDLFPCLPCLQSLCVRVGSRVESAIKLCEIGFRNFGTTAKTYSYVMGPCKKDRPSVKFQSLARIGYPDEFLPLTLSEKDSATRVARISYSTNDAHKKLGELAKCPPIAITDPKLQKRTFEEKKVVFSSKGWCKGMSQWLVSMYLQTKHLYANPQKHMLVLSQIFADGAPMEAALLQSLFIGKGKILNLSFGEKKGEFGWATPVLKIALTKDKGKQQIKNPSAIAKELGKLKVGAYCCSFPIHDTVYIKTAPELSYWFDPNTGMFEIAGPDQGAELFKQLNYINYFGDKKNEDFDIELYSTTLRDGAIKIEPGDQQKG